METQLEQVTEPKTEIPVDIEGDIDWSKYVEEEAAGQQSLPDSPDRDPEEVYQEAGENPEGMRDPRMKLGLVGGGFSLMALIIVGLFARGCTGDETRTIAKNKPLTPEQQEIQNLNTDKKNQAAMIERLLQEKEAQKRLQAYNAKNGAKAVKAKVRPVTPAPSSRPVSIARAYMAPPQRPVASPVARPRPIAPQRTESDDTKVNALAAQIAQLQNQIAAQAQQEKVEASPQMENVVATTETPVEPVNGGFEEAALLSGTPPITIPAGTKATATLETPIAGTQSKVVLALKTDITDDQGKAVIPAGSQLLGAASIVGGIANVSVTGAVVNGQMVEIPAQFGTAIAVMKGKSPLVAKKIGGGNKFGQMMLGGLLNAGSAFAGQMLQPSTTTSFSSAGGVVSQSQNSANTIGNAALAAGGGLVSSLGSGVQQQIQANSQDTQSAIGVKAGTEVNLLFTAPVQMLQASNVTPVSYEQSTEPVEPVAQPDDATVLQQPLVTPQDVQDSLHLPAEQPEGQSVNDSLNQPLVPSDSGQLIDPVS